MQTPKQALRVSFSQVGAGNTSMSFLKSSMELQPSLAETSTSSRYNLEPYGLAHPVQVRDVLKASRDHSEYNVVSYSRTAFIFVLSNKPGASIKWWSCPFASVRMGIARNKDKNLSLESPICKEFALPSSEANTDQFSTDLVCFYPPPPSVNTTSFPRHVGLVAVSPAGVAFSWSNVLQHDKTKGCIEKLVVDGGGAHSLQCIPEIGCLLATRDCRYFIITPVVRQGQSGITVRQLSSGGMISGIARRFSSVWFQSSMEVTKVLRKVVISSFMDNKCAYILTDTRIEKWSIGQSPQQIYDVLLESLLAERLAEASVNDMVLKYIDLKVAIDQILILVAMVNPTRRAEVSSDNDMATDDVVTLATVVLTADTPSPRLQDVIIINSEVTYQGDNLYKWHLLSKECCHDDDKILSIHGGHSDTLECLQDKIIGSGHFDGHNLLLLAKAGMMKLQLKSSEVSKYNSPVAVKKAKKRSMRRSLLPQEMPTDDHLNVLKKAFQCYCEGNVDEAHLLLQQQFFQSFAQRQGCDTCGDAATVEISNLLLDDIPDADPRWAEDHSQDSSSTNTIILYQLEDKLIAHDRLMQFFIDTGVLARLTAVTVDGRRLRTVDYLCEHAEKLVAAMTMKQLPNETFDGAIELVMESRKTRGVTIKPNLTMPDLFYREVSCIDNIFKALSDDQEVRLRSLADHNSRIRLVATVMSTYETILHEACQHRHNKYLFYHAMDVTIDPVQFIPWTATDHVRQLVTKQLDIVVGMGIHETTYQHKELLWQSFVSLVDIILNGYCEQINSIRDVDKRKELNCVYEVERARLLQLLTQIGLTNSVVSLAEKYQDFPTLMSICESTTEPRRSEMLHEYMIHFVNEGFARFVFQKYKEQGRVKELMSAPVECYQQLEQFLAPYEELRWLHEIQTKQYHSACSTLITCADIEEQSLSKQKNFLSISKLSLLASSCPPEEKQSTMEELELKLRLIDYQENLIKASTKEDNEEFLVPLTADQLIEYYTADDVTTALSNFLCALEILSIFYPDHHGDSFIHLRLIISSRAILQNDWQHIPVEDTLDALKSVFFFQLAQAALDKGLNVLELLPGLHELSCCDKLHAVNQLPSFVAIMNSGYEQLDRVTNKSFDD